MANSVLSGSRKLRKRWYQRGKSRLRRGARLLLGVVEMRG
jgi:hypothetical protein